MSRRRAIYSSEKIAVEPQQTLPFPETVAEPAPEGYHVRRGWISTAGRTRTWNLLDPSGQKVAEIVAKRDAQKIADAFNRITSEIGKPDLLP
jgi:hypothetical protein